MTDVGLEILRGLGETPTHKTELVRADGQLAVLHTHSLQDAPESRGALVAAIRRAKNLDHPRLQSVRAGSGESYFLGLAPGETLGSLVSAARRAGRDALPAAAVKHLALQMAEGLGALHDAGQAYGPMDLDRIHIALEGNVSLMDRPGAALSAQSSSQGLRLRSGTYEDGLPR